MVCVSTTTFLLPLPFVAELIERTLCELGAGEGEGEGEGWGLSREERGIQDGYLSDTWMIR